MDVVNPSTGERIESYETHTKDDIDGSLDQATTAFEEWRNRPLREREELLESAAEVLRENKQEYAETMTREMGKPITQAVSEVEKCAWVCDHYAKSASEYLQPEGHSSPPGSSVKTVYEPLGPVLAVMPWNNQTPACPSAASRSPDTAVNSPVTVSGSSSTGRRSGWNK
jgi:succinate-semialdehyde dehydrogenase/glutarate-semialdehyde dehydrogenase